MATDSPASEDRKRIIDAAYQCLSERHVNPVSVAAILARAECSSRAFYRHFESKDALFLAMVEEESAALTRRLDRIVAEHPGTPIEQLQAWVEQLFALVYDPALREHMQVIDSDEVRSAKGFREVRERAHIERERSLRTILTRGRADGSMPLTDPECDAVAIGAVVARALLEQTDLTDDEYRVGVECVMDFALRAIGADHTPYRR
ncbi:TetR/AcrR family transcriptional regulator [Mycolicibacterium thermoresistibile]|uniref:TetR family transcriptional regulator n=2 Tax=Mycolicibacterium thermoresistibile TaxID=1797 RepID=G7CE72_MYCT3|nr:TetR/AcrR family transcriptional regulator [Mycolicibacterium thermoresistibile]EHI13721.1 TetR family transcriptional regulator [Mycolicibacterium thermoresistibile ATCC 19527]MCV7189355.1 TetR/AcrR family transcriptional regulator [Mycolicibacterium thermoresistibile]GAT14442.1 TetR family transcriptional regulator [Mycolicibacterium thermoresistibile]SNW19675.1 transcriptional regulator [Mycolicibacterium thermoresistibile]